MLNDDRRVTRDDLDADTGRRQSGHGIGGACLGRVDEYAQPREYEAAVVVRVDPCRPAAFFQATPSMRNPPAAWRS